ncbi:MAG TPA: sulfatase, partial [Alistipes sp.]|nr:sulfatase [Alistipes sp.]
MQKSIRLVSGLYLKLSLLTVAVGLVLRVVLLFNEQTTSLAFSFGEWCEVFLLGAVNDFCAATAGFIFLWLFMLSVSRTKYRKPWGYILLALLVAAFCYVAFFNTIFDEYGSVAPRIALYVLGYWAGSFALRLFLPGFRSHWTTVWFALFIVVYVGAIIFNGISEYFFWSEFGVRYNFIAVDYLVYTNEVVGNIMESYPVIPMTLGIVVVTLLVTWYFFRSELVQTECLKGWRWKAVIGPAYVAALFAAIGLLNFNTRFQDSDNVYVNELQANGLYKFYDAFVKNTLDYEQFYLTRPEAEAEAFVHGVYQSTGDNLHAVRAEGEEIRRNIVLITMESMSASYMERFGNTERITPALDSLYKLGLAFDRVYATGNRTVRGLEAVTLSLPPCPGQSIIKRPNNAGMHSTGALLRDKGYNVTYFYGGNSYFDNMETFFSGNGYDIVDQKSYKPEEITFANIWGVCDEDAYRKVIRTLNEETRSGKPFFAHVMTVSNHRPFTYP